MKRYFKKAQLEQFREKLPTIGPKTERLMLALTAFQFEHERAQEYARHGVARRIQTMRRCIENVFKLVPPGAVKVPSRPRLKDAEINIQAFLANTYGTVDNLGWVWVYETGLSDKVGQRDVGLRSKNKAMRASLSKELREYLEGLDDRWFNWLVEYRDAFAHRIPLYIPRGVVLQSRVDAYNDLTRRMTDALNGFRPYEYETLEAEQNKLLSFQPWITHSVRDAQGHYVFHAQMIADFLTIEELAQKMLAALRERR